MEKRTIAHARLDVLRKISSDHDEIAALTELEQQLAKWTASYRNHVRQLFILMRSSAAVAFAVFALAVIGGHLHSARVVALVYAPLLVTSAVSAWALGTRVRFVALSRGFSLAFVALGFWSLLAASYAVWTRAMMRRWHDWALLSLQVLDILLALGTLWTAEQLAGIGGQLTVILVEADRSGLLVTKHTSHLRAPGAANDRLSHRWWQNWLVAPD